MRTHQPLTIILIALFALSLGACKPTNQKVIEEYAPQYAQLRTDLAAIASSLNPASDEMAVTQILDPRPLYTYGAKEIQNTDILMLENLFDPDRDLRQEGQLDLTLSNYLLRLLRWTGPQNPMSSTALDNPASDESVHEFEQALQIRYLGVAAVLQYDPPRAVSEEQFTGGLADMMGFLVDMQSRQVLCNFRFTATANQEVSYTYEEGDSKTQALERYVYSTLWTNARAAFIEKMNQACGGDFSLEE